MTHLSFNRRQFLGGSIAAGVACAVPQAGGAAPLPGFSSPAAQLRAMIMMRGALDGRLVISCIACHYWGVVNAQMTPFYDLVAATFARYRKASYGGYDVVSFEMEYFIDRTTNDVLDKWKNPYTGEIVVAKHTDSVPVKYRIGPDCQLELPPTPLFAGSKMSHITEKLRIIGNDVWSNEVTTASVPTQGGKPILFNERVTNHTTLATLSAPGAQQARSDSQYIGISSFRPWQKMGDHPGNMLGLGVGATGIALSEVPEPWQRITRARHPQALRNPGAYLEPLWNTL